jgi:cytochrome d ubiquinol oxidase subunit II
MVSSLNPAWSLTIQNAASSATTLRLMTIVTLIFLPIVLIYQAWTYWTFRKRVSGEAEKLTY